ncbi:hypothetical protein CARUB_v10025960mg [Capsella rubella]|uniref:Receptor-like serine/threonine-protein kinase n=1 Tax=Capsella rubella TaxID=81985 RepID=R0EV33_9BRAS|nr:hypothetical protein CARUB_v10025960mg [Capsella rubella]
MNLGEDKGTIVSPGKIFELGLFKGTTSVPYIDRWYLGIWYKRFPEAVVWVANRDNHLHNSTATLIFSSSSSTLKLVDQSGGVVWTSQLRNRINNQRIVPELLDNGNFVFREQLAAGFLWESFDSPTDTLLPGMKLGWDRRTNVNTTSLRSWKSLYDPSYGDYKFQVEIWELSQGFIWKNEDMYLQSRIGLSNHDRIFNITESSEEATCTLAMSSNASLHSALRMTFTGSLQLFVERNLVWSIPFDQCDVYDACGFNSYCAISSSKLHCICLPGFHQLPDSKTGCVRRSQLSCPERVDFTLMNNMKLPSTEGTIVDSRAGIEECRARCATNCTCTAFASTDIRNGESGCVMWNGDLVDVRSESSNRGQDLYVKHAVPDLVSKETNQDLIIKRDEDWGSKVIDFEVIAAATNNFSDNNKLGKGGFGIVYKGQLSHGQEIAVKRLSEMTPKGVEGFAIETKLIAMLQHTNLVRLVGFCSNADEKILVYEFLENSSLDRYLFDTTRGSLLNWEYRMKITLGIVRGLVYLHHDSRFRIIHLDLKPANVLLDKDMSPKISDFGMAKILGGDETEAHVTTVKGTFSGYIAPEYRNDGTISVKSDVFSFGVMVLEIVSGKRNIDFLNLDDGSTLLSYIWQRWSEGNGLEIVDPAIKDSSSSVFPQVLRCIQIGLLCVQPLPEDRPTMSAVGLMLAREAEVIPLPRSPVEIGSSSRGGQEESVSGTVPDITMFIECR